MSLMDVFVYAADNKASDIFIVADSPIVVKVYGRPHPQGDILSAPEVDEVVTEIYKMAGRSMDRVRATGDDDFGLEIEGVSRFRVSAYKQKNTLAVTMRLIPNSLPNPKKLHIPDGIMQLAKKQKGLVLVTGTTGSGKSTTLACLIDAINHSRTGHIVTVEDPIEYIHHHGSSVVSQREIERDTETYLTALRAALRQAPDVILVGEMRDYETVSVALTAAETGHLVFSTLHTIGAASTIDRIIDVFPGDQQNQIRSQTSMVLQSVISQQLIPTVDGKVTAAYEIMHCTNAIRNLIREGKTHQIDNTISMGTGDGMVGMDASVFKLYQEGRISADNAIRYAVLPETMRQRVAQAEQEAAKKAGNLGGMGGGNLGGAGGAGYGSGGSMGNGSFSGNIGGGGGFGRGGY